MFMTLAPSLIAIVAGLAVCSSAVFVCQAATASYLGHIAGKSRASAAGLYSTFLLRRRHRRRRPSRAGMVHGGWPACVLLMVLISESWCVLAFTFWRPVWIHPQTTAAAAAAVVGD